MNLCLLKHRTSNRYATIFIASAGHSNYSGNISELA